MDVCGLNFTRLLNEPTSMACAFAYLIGNYIPPGRTKLIHNRTENISLAQRSGRVLPLLRLALELHQEKMVII